MKYTPRLPRINDNVSPDSLLKEFAILLGGLLGIVVAIYIGLGLAVDLLVPRISIETEQRMAGFFSQLTDSAETSSDRAAFLQGLTDGIREHCAPLPYEIRVLVSENKMANALALPGGTIIVFSGLLETISSENELAFVLAHELGHFHHRDHLRAMGRSLVFMALSALLFGTDSGVGDLLAQSVGVTELGFSRIQETRADEFGVAAVNCFYGNMGGATDFFEKMREAEDPMHFGQYFSSHPEVADRIQHIKDFGQAHGFSSGTLKDLPNEIQSTE